MKRRIRWKGHVARMGKKRNAYRILEERAEGKRSLGRPRRRWEDDIKMDLREIEWSALDWIDLPQDKDQCRNLVNSVIKIQALQNVGKFLSSLLTVGFSRKA
jgi:hypothetical protein